MILAAAICVLAVGVSAQVGPSGIVSPDGQNTQFSHAFANDIVLVGPAGIVTKSGINRQLTHGEATLNLGLPVAPAAPLPVSQYVHQGGVIGHSGIVRPDGNNVQFTQAQADNIVLIGPSGIVTKDGSNIQFTDDLHFAHRAKRALIGPSGMITADGTPIQFSKAGTYILLDGPSGYVLSDGTLVQKRAKRSSGFVTAKGNVGHSGILRIDGTTDLFSHDLAHDILLIGPSGIVTKSGRNIQLTSDLNIANPRTKRSLEGALIGASGIITKSGQLIQLEAGVSIVQAGPSGLVLSNGRNIQFN